jgi:hypothetical protein
MTTIINASTSGGLVQSADTSGVLELQTGGVTAMTVSAAQVVTFVNTPVGAGAFAAGTVLLFYQAAAPTGWTQVTTQNDKALRVVSGTGGGTGGTTAFTSVFTSRTPAGTVSGTVGGTTLTAAQSGVPAHTHAVTDPTHSHTFALRTTDVTSTPTVADGTGNAGTAGTQTTAAASTGISIQNSVAAGASASHNHTFTGSFTGTAMDFAVQYIDLIICVKN